MFMQLYHAMRQRAIPTATRATPHDCEFSHDLSYTGSQFGSTEFKIEKGMRLMSDLPATTQITEAPVKEPTHTT